MASLTLTFGPAKSGLKAELTAMTHAMIDEMIENPEEPTEYLKEAMGAREYVGEGRDAEARNAEAERAPSERATQRREFEAQMAAYEHIKNQLASPTPPPAFDDDAGQDFEVEE